MLIGNILPHQSFICYCFKINSFVKIQYKNKINHLLISFTKFYETFKTIY